MTVKQMAAGVFGNLQAPPKLGGLPMNISKAQSQLPNNGRKHTAHIENLDPETKNGSGNNDL